MGLSNFYGNSISVVEEQEEVVEEVPVKKQVVIPDIFSKEDVEVV